MAGELISWVAASGQSQNEALTTALLNAWRARSLSAAQIELTSDPLDTPDPREWVVQFREWDPTLLRHYLSSDEQTVARVRVVSDTSAALVKEMCLLLCKAFDRILFTVPPHMTPDILPVLDASDFLLWVGTKSEGDLFQQLLDQLTVFHFPHHSCHVVFLDEGISKCVKTVPAVFSRQTVLSTLPPRAVSEVRFLQAVSELSQRLESPELSKISNSNETHAVDGATQAVERLRESIEPQLLKAIDAGSSLENGLAQKTAETFMAQDASLPNDRGARGAILSRVLDDVLGMGPLEPLLKDSTVSEIMVNGHGCIFTERQGRLYPSDVTLTSDEQLRTLIDRIVAPIGRRVDESMPLCDARLSDGSRVNIVLPPLALDGPVLTIRKFPSQALGLNDLIAKDSLSDAMGAFLKTAVRQRLNIVVSGGTGSGKTTLLNALSSAIPDDERIITIEDAAELRLQKPHVIRLESRPANAEGHGAISIRSLVANALRMRPDRIVIGECRGGEALDMLQAMNTGHDGSLTTLHANAPRDALGRLETLVLMAGMDLPVRVVREQIRSAIHLIVQQSRLLDGSRKITSITEVTGLEEGTLVTQELFSFREGIFRSESVSLRCRTSNHGVR